MTEDDVIGRWPLRPPTSRRPLLTCGWTTPAPGVHAAVDALGTRLVPFEHNVARRHPESQGAHRSPDERGRQDERLLERVRLAFGDTVVALEHIGTPSVPGCPPRT